MSDICKICNNSINNTLYIAKENMLGTGDSFEYMECSYCKCIQIVNIPLNISEYYPKTYYSYQKRNEISLLNSKIKLFLKKKLIEHYFNKFNVLGFLLSIKYKNPFPWLNERIKSTKSKILDVGCGSGELLLSMKSCGFDNISGADPYIEKHINYKCGLQIHKKDLKDLNEKYDLIMMHHSFEHMPSPLETLIDINNLLNNKGFLIIRVPVASCYAWRKYGINWVQLDPPRHFFLHTTNSIQYICKKSGFELVKVKYDSDHFQFTGSEKYLRSLTLNEEYHFDRDLLKNFGKEAKRLNNICDGDSACFYLYKP